MNSKSQSLNTKENEDELKEDFSLLRQRQLEKNDELKEIDEENVVTEFNAVAFLSASKLSIKKSTSDNKNQTKNKFKEYFRNMPLKGFILAALCAILNSINLIITKLITEFSGNNI